MPSVLSQTNPFHNQPNTVAAALVAVALAKHGDNPAPWIRSHCGHFIDTIGRGFDLLKSDPTDCVYTAAQLRTAEVVIIWAMEYAITAVNALPHDLDAVTSNKEASIMALKAAGL
jgi:hypothetical protein